MLGTPQQNNINNTKKHVNITPVYHAQIIIIIIITIIIIIIIIIIITIIIISIIITIIIISIIVTIIISSIIITIIIIIRLKKKNSMSQSLWQIEKPDLNAFFFFEQQTFQIWVGHNFDQYEIWNLVLDEQVTRQNTEFKKSVVQSVLLCLLSFHLYFDK